MAEPHQLVHDLVLLVDLDRVHVAVAPPVAVLGDCVLEAPEQGAYPAVQDVGEPHQEWDAEAPALEVQHQIV